jgi:glycine/D-amino acid oxidase-like deaminating enzyme
MQRAYRYVVIGGGFFGAQLAVHLCRRPGEVLLVEREPDLMTRASYHNQARVHNGYHYPRSFQTAVRSHLNFQRFVETYPECIDRSFDKLYAVSRRFSHVTAEKFYHFCRRTGAPIEPAPTRLSRLFDRDYVEAVFSVTEYAFDSRRLRCRMKHDLQRAGVQVETGTVAERLAVRAGGELEVQMAGPAGAWQAVAGEVFNCTYADLNGLLSRSGLPAIPLRHEWTELVLVRPPAPLCRIGVTVMCGPFFSLMPFPARGLHSFSHVRYTPHCSWDDSGQSAPEGLPRVSAFGRMQRDALRYLPATAQLEAVESLWQVKTILPRNEVDDGRPVMYRRDHGIAGLHCVLGAKIDNIFDLLEMIPSENRQQQECLESIG